ncbi:MAG: tripartite tricarboxylate transporter substrate binding protein [Betaproteobacteria bacterium]|nr:tripartite tricarboxylate transporter substrate binding protein [Betaproteobacteria bacterium]
MRVLLTAIVLAAAASAAAAQPYPSRPIRMILPNPPGGANDIVGRIVAQKLSTILGQQLVVDNRGGAGGAIGAEIAASAVPDGHTLLAATFATHTTVPHLHKKIAYDPLGGFVPIALFAVQYSMLSAHPGFPPNTVKDLIAYAKAKPGAINYASAGPGSTSDFTGRMFAKTADIQFTLVHYKGGGPAITALLAGEAQINFGPIPATAPLVRGGRLKAIAVSGTTRSVAMPDVPTVSESGVPGFSASAWVGLMAPVGTPRPIIEKLAAAAKEALESGDVREQLIKAGAEPAFKPPQPFAQFVREEYERYGKLVRELGLKAL